MNFLQSKPAKDFLEQGKLPTIDTNVKIETSSIINLCIGILIMAVLIIVAHHLVTGGKK